MLERLAFAAPVAALLTLVTASACLPGAAPPNTEGTTSSGSSSTDGPVATTFAGPDACQSSEECETEGLCVAPYDPGSDPPMGQGGCIQACIEIDDLTRWCFDDEGCCGNARCQVIDGLCEPGPGSTGDDTGTSTDTGSSTDTGTSTDTGSSTGTGSSTSTGTSTG